MFFGRYKVYKMEEDSFKYTVTTLIDNDMESKYFNSFLRKSNKEYSNNIVNGKISKKKVDGETRFTYEITLDKRTILNTVFFNIMRNHLDLTDPKQEGYYEEYYRIKNLIICTCNKIQNSEFSVVSEYKVDEVFDELNEEEQVVYCELYEFTNKVIDSFISKTFEMASICSTPPMC